MKTIHVEIQSLTYYLDHPYVKEYQISYMLFMLKAQLLLVLKYFLCYMMLFVSQIKDPRSA